MIKSFTVRTVCRDMRSMFMLLHTPRLAIIVTKSSSVWIVCRDMWLMFMKMGLVTTWGELHIQLKYPKQPRN